MIEQVHAIRRFNRFYTRFLGLLGERFLESPVSLTEARVLLEIHNSPGCKARDIMEFLGLDRGYLSRMLKRFERAGLVRRDANPRDRRVRDLSLTEEGERLLAGVDQRASAQIEAILAALADNERGRLVRAMGDIEEILVVRAGGVAERK